MSVEPVLILIVIGVLANLLVMAAVLLPPLRGRRGLFEPVPEGLERPPAEPALAAGEDGPVTDFEADVPTWAYDRVVRIVSWVFILAATTIVAVSGLWRENQALIYVLLALAGLFVLIVHDLLPSRLLGPAKFILEGSVALTFATLLVILTGRERSPFFFIFPLVVAGAALVVSPRITLVLASVGSMAYLVALTVGASEPLAPETVAVAGINLTALILLAYVAMVIAREQRRAKDAAVRLSTVDPLTGLYNRTYFFAAVEREIARSTRSGRGFCLLMMDLDDLKTTNDRYGHFVGDLLLSGVGEVIRDGVRRIDTAARYGGDEFVVLLPETEITGAYVVAEKIRLGVADLSAPGTEA
ncbi:MAG TPA: GGDEF domain-containing protein, partial [Vitreimonas sp.]|nr:GGDEF domain-containing protein [Vitreimonas sp.]